MASPHGQLVHHCELVICDSGSYRGPCIVCASELRPLFTFCYVLFLFFLPVRKNHSQIWQGCDYNSERDQSFGSSVLCAKAPIDFIPALLTPTHTPSHTPTHTPQPTLTLSLSSSPLAYLYDSPCLIRNDAAVLRSSSQHGLHSTHPTPPHPTYTAPDQNQHPTLPYTHPSSLHSKFAPAGDNQEFDRKSLSV